MRTRLLCLAVTLPLVHAPAQTFGVPLETVTTDVDSGYLHNPDDQEHILYRTVVATPEAAWMRVFLRDTNLPGASRLRLTSLRDGAVQHFDARSLREYGYGSAYFNGPQVRIELVAAPGTRANRLHVDTLDYSASDPGTGVLSICGPTDDRTLATDPRIARGVSGASACTWWLFENEFSIATAGHCTGSLSTTWIIGFNIPLSTSNGTMVQPPPDDQYAIDMSTVQLQNSGQGADWAVMTAVRNSNHGLYPGEKQGSWFELGAVPTTPGTTIRITGNGRVSSPVSPTWNSVTKTHTGPLASTGSTTITYQTDTTGGNSGSPVIHEATGEAVGIHTHGGCGFSSGANLGTRIDRSGLSTAITQVVNTKVVGRLSTTGTGCGGPAGVPQLALSGIPDISNTIQIDVTDLPPGQSGVIALGLSDTIWEGNALPLDMGPFGLEGCTLYASLDAVIPIDSGSGSANVPITLPELPSLVTADVHFQALVLDPAASRTLPAVLSNGGTLIIGG